MDTPNPQAPQNANQTEQPAAQTAKSNSAAAPSQQANTIPQTGSPAPQPNPSPEKQANHVMAALAYIPFFFVITSLQKGKDPFCLWHAKNGAGLTFFFLFPLVIGAWISIFIGTLLYLIHAIVGLIAFIQAFQGKKWEIPFISSYAKNIPLEKWFKLDSNLAPTQTNSSNPPSNDNLNRTN